MVSDIFTGQMINQNYINISGVANIVCLIKPLSNDESTQI